MIRYLIILTFIFFTSTQTVFASSTPPAPRLCDIMKPIQNIISVAIAAGGIGFFIMIIWGSITLLTAGGNSQRASQAQSTITWAFLGLVLLVASYAILMIIDAFTGVNLKQIEFPWIGTSVNRPDGC